MINYSSVDAVSGNDLEGIIDLFSDAFPGEKKSLGKNFSSEFKKNKKINWVLAKKAEKIIGAVLLRPLQMNYCGEILEVCGMSYYAIASDYQKSDVANNIKNLIFKFANDFDICLGFARKKMDGYWAPHNFVGVTDFGNFTIKLIDLYAINVRNPILIKRPCPIDIEKIIKFYNQNNKFLIGNLVRDHNNFDEAFLEPDKFGEVKCFFYQDRLCGYFIIKNDTIIEIRVDQAFNHEIACALKSYFRHKGQELIQFHTHFNDPFLTYLSQYSHTRHQRYCFEGGHIVRINKRNIFLNKISKALSSKLAQYRLSPFIASDGNLFISYKNQNLDITIKDTYDIRRLTKLAFGVEVMHDNIFKLVFGGQNTQFPEFDHF